MLGQGVDDSSASSEISKKSSKSLENRLKIFLKKVLAFSEKTIYGREHDDEIGLDDTKRMRKRTG